MDSKRAVSDKELNDLKESLRGNPELFARIADIVRLSEASGAEGKVDINDVEEALIPKIRQLGQETLRSVARSVEERAGKELKKSDPTARQREKKR